MALKHNLLPQICIFFNRQEYKCSFEFGYLFFTEAVQDRLQKLHTQKHKGDQHKKGSINMLVNMWKTPKRACTEEQ